MAPQVGIVMGSDSDWPKIKKAAAALAEFDVEYEVRVMSAHRTPDVVLEYATSAVERGLRVIIAAAGGDRSVNYFFLITFTLCHLFVF